MVLYDEATKEPYCVRILNGALTQTAGKCDAAVPSNGSGEADGEGDTEAPVISLNGNNPATIEVGQTYGDLGAVVTDNSSNNLGYTISVNGGEAIDPSALTLDTSAPGTFTLTFSATDQAGNVGTAERVVTVEPIGGTAVSTPPAEPAAEPATEPAPEENPTAEGEAETPNPVVSDASTGDTITP